MGSQRLATGHGLGAWCSGKQHSTAQHGAPHTYLPMIEFSTSTGGSWQGQSPVYSRYIAAVPLPAWQSGLRFI